MTNNYNFSYITSPHSIEDFFQKYWEYGYLYICRKNENYYNEILNVEDIEFFLQNQTLHPAYLKLISKGSELSADKWTKIQVLSTKNYVRVVDNEKLFNFLYQGNTLLVSFANMSFPKLNNFCITLERELKFRLQFNIYITPSNAQGLAAHYDDHDVFILQVAGTKLWRLYHSPIELPSRKQRFHEDKYLLKEPQLEVELNAGDLLYIPRGLIHEAYTTDTTSIHVTLGFHPNYWFDFLQEIVELAQDNPAFRRASPHGFTNDYQKNIFKNEFRQLSQALIENLDMDELLERRFEQFTAKKRSSNQNRFLELIQINNLNLNSILSHRKNIFFQVEKDRHNICVNFNQKKLIFPNFLETSLNTILENNFFAVKDINGLINNKGKIQLATQFIQEGFLTIEEINAEK